MTSKKQITSVGAFLSFILAFVSVSFAKGPGTAVETLLNDSLGARPSALGDAFSAATNDIAALGSNPATLRTLQESHLSFIYQKGLMEDSKGHVSLGMPVGSQTFGISVGFYDGGDLKTLDPLSSQEKTLKAKEELNLIIGTGFNWSKMAIGLSGKYLRSTLADTESATAFAADLGLQTQLNSALSIGLAVQNLGSQLKYVDEGDDLSRTLRAGLQWQFAQKLPSTLFLDVPYNMVEGEVETGVGLEFMVGPMALRAGYKDASEDQSLSFGAGFALSRMTLDYTYGLADRLDDQHMVSFGLRFGGSASSSRDEVKLPQRNQVAFQFEKHKSLGGQIYEIKSGDSLGQIAQAMYGSRDAWKRIYEANRHLLQDPTTLTPGQKVVLP